MTERSCGTIPYTVKNGVIQYLLIKTKKSEIYAFPKGHVEQNECDEETALRETLEETSLHVSLLDGFRYQITYPLSRHVKKTVVYFLASFQDEIPKRNGNFEEFDYLLLPFDKAYERLTFDNTKDMLRAANTFLTGRKNR